MTDATALCARVLVDELARHGLRHAVLAPGSRSAPLALALAGDERVALHVQLDERSAAFTALGIAKASGYPAVVLCTSGTAAANLHPAVAEAAEARVPLLVLTADRPPELRSTAANQTIDQMKLFGSAVRWFCEVGVPHEHPGATTYWRSTASHAWASALGSPAGPVHLNLAFREPLVPAGDLPDRGSGGREGGRPWTEMASGARIPHEDEIARLAEAIRRAERGAIVAGASGVHAPPVLALARRAGFPILAEPASNMRRGPNALAHHDLLLRDTRFAAERRPGLVLRIGKHGLSKATAAWLSEEVPQVLVDADGAWTDPDRRAETIIAADPAATCAAVADLLGERHNRDWLNGWLQADLAAARVVNSILEEGEAPSEPRTARDLAAGLPDGSALLVASSMPVRDLDAFMGPRDGLRVLANRGANGIDGLVSTAFGIALAHVGLTAALLGDLALLHDSNGFLLKDRPDCVFVVVNNDGGGIFSFLPQADLPEHFEALFGTPQGVSLADLARLHRLGHVRIERASDLAPALEEALSSGGVHLIEVPTNRAENVALHRRLAEAVAHAVT